MPQPPSGFVEPPWDVELDPQLYFDDTPSEALVKGMYPKGLIDQLNARGTPAEGYGRFRAFKDYPLVDYMRLEVDAARLMFPDVSLREGLRRVGWTAYPILRESLIGKVIFGAFGDSVGGIVKLASKAYRSSLTMGHAETLEQGEGHAIVRLSQMYNFADSYQVGVFEGVLRHQEREGGVLIKAEQRWQVDVYMWWR